jgi:HSP90 family molecular chaperone
MPKTKKFIKKTENFIETGSYLGDGIQLAIDSGFSKIYSIELGPHLYEGCKRRFANQPNVNLILGDSSEKLKELFNVQIADLHVTTEVKGLSADSAPVVATRPEFMRRMKDMAGVGGGMTAFYAQMPDEVTLTVNGNHPIYQTLLKEGNADLQKSQVRNLADLALLSQGLLKGNDLTNFINRSVDLLQNK